METESQTAPPHVSKFWVFVIALAKKNFKSQQKTKGVKRETVPGFTAESKFGPKSKKSRTLILLLEYVTSN